MTSLTSIVTPPRPVALDGHGSLEQSADKSKKRKSTPNSINTKSSSKKVKRVGPRSPVLTPTQLAANGEGGTPQDNESTTKPKRVRTGCLTCRERHLKCDEAAPECNNCRKSNRRCKRGIKLNFLEILVEKPPTLMTPQFAPGRMIEFLDESREIASEYQGGTERYAALDLQRRDSHRPQPRQNSSFGQPFHFATASHRTVLQAPMPSQQLFPSTTQQESVGSFLHDSQRHAGLNHTFERPKQDPAQYASTLPESNSTSTQRSFYNDPGGGTAESSIVQDSVASYQTNDTDHEELAAVKKNYLDNQEETLFMQVFVEEVGLWMDSMDSQKHFSRLLPFHSLGEPMLLNAFLACGAKHLTLVNPAYSEERALHYYDTATHHLLRNLTNPNRDTVVCATTAVILNVYEVMSERATQRMNHIAGARALIKECGWNARSQGIGAACFWLNVGLEVLSCLHFNWQVAWSPDDWGLDMDTTREQMYGREELWTHRMLYIIAKVCNFRATTPRTQEVNSRDEQVRMQQRSEQWSQLKAMCEAWNSGIPRTMQPMAFLYPYQTSDKSCFPEVWLVKRTTIVARLFYHTAMLLLSQVHPYLRVNTNTELMDMQTRHAQMICGIVAHVKDRGVASVAIRSLAHAAEVLNDRKEQEEVITIFERINRETGWRVGYVYGELMSKWGWTEEPSPLQFAQTHTGAAQRRQSQQLQQQQPQPLVLPPPPTLQPPLMPPPIQQLPQQPQTSMQSNFLPRHGLSTVLSTTPPQLQQASAHKPPLLPPPTVSPSQMSQQQQQVAVQKPRRMPSGIVNPLVATADFTLPQHPYQQYYVAPSHEESSSHLPHSLYAMQPHQGGHLFQHTIR